MEESTTEMLATAPRQRLLWFLAALCLALVGVVSWGLNRVQLVPPSEPASKPVIAVVATATPPSDLALESHRVEVPLVSAGVRSAPRPLPRPSPPPAVAPPRPVARAAPHLPEPDSYPRAPNEGAGNDEPSSTLSLGDYLARAHREASAFDRAMGNGKLDATTMGTGRADHLAEMSLENEGDKPVHLHLVPGMVLRPPGNDRQPLLVDEDADIDLQPGESWNQSLRTYCMDAGVPAPYPFEEVDYRFRDQSASHAPDAVRVLRTSHAMDEAGELEGPRELSHREFVFAVTQEAVWMALQQEVSPQAQASVLGMQGRNRRVGRVVREAAERLLLESRK